MNFRCESGLRAILIIKDNYSDFIRSACWEKLEREGDHTLIDQDILKHEQIIKDLKVKKKGPKFDKNKVNAILNREYESFKHSNRIMTDDHHNLSWIEARIIPELLAIGCRMNKNEILAIFQDQYKGGKVLIDVR